MLPRLPALLVAASMIVGGCGYTSSYVAPDGWRARPIYNGNDVEMVGSTELPKCTFELEEAPPEGDYPRPMYIDDHGYWVPVPRVHVVFWGPPPVHLPHPFIFHPPGPHNLILGSLLRGTSSSSGGSNGKGAGMVFALMAAVAVVASSGVAIGLAADPPEDNDVAGDIDAINQHNDRVREKIAECMRSAAERREPAPAPVAEEPASQPHPAQPAPTVSDAPPPSQPAPARPTQPAPTVRDAPAPAQPPAATPSALRPSDPGAPTLRDAPKADEPAPAERAPSVDEEVPW